MKKEIDINNDNQIKQSQNQKAIEVLHEILDKFNIYTNFYGREFVDPKSDEYYLLSFLEKKITELKGEK